MAITHSTQIQGSAGLLEVDIDMPEHCSKGIAFLAHPLTVVGGSKDHKVITTMSRALTSVGWMVIRGNFRGAGASEGQYEAGFGETEDFLTIIDRAFEMRGVVEMLPATGRVIFGGFSFGAYVASLAAQVRKPAGMILAGPGIARFNVPIPATPTFVVHGECDEIIPLQMALTWCANAGLSLTVVPGADHVFAGKLPLLGRELSRFAALI